MPSVLQDWKLRLVRRMSDRVHRTCISLRRATESDLGRTNADDCTAERRGLKAELPIHVLMLARSPQRKISYCTLRFKEWDFQKIRTTTTSFHATRLSSQSLTNLCYEHQGHAKVSHAIIELKAASSNPLQAKIISCNDNKQLSHLVQEEESDYQNL